MSFLRRMWDRPSWEERASVGLIAGLIGLVVLSGVLALLVWRSGGAPAGPVAALNTPATGPTATLPPTVAPAVPTSAPSTVPTAPASPPAAPTATRAVEVTATPVAPTPVPGTVWYFAEGSSLAPFRTRYVLFNPGETAVQVKVTALPPTGAPVTASFTVKAKSRLTVAAEKLVANAPFAARLEGDRAFYVERVTTFGHDAYSGTGLLPGKTWYLPVLETAAGDESWILLANFNAVPAKAAVTFLAQGGLRRTLSYTVPAMSRLSISATKDLAPYSDVRPGTPRGAVVESDQPIVVEHTTYFAQAQAGYSSGGSAVAAQTWYLAEGNTRTDFETTLAILNPGSAPAVITATYILEGLPKITRRYTVPAASPLHINLKLELPQAAAATVLTADQPVVVERVMYFNQGQAADASLGSQVLAKEWYLPEASTEAPNVPVLILLNPGNVPAEIVVRFFREEGSPVEKRVTLAGSTRLALILEQDVPNAPLSVGVSASQPLVVERVTYFRKASGGMASMGIPGP